MTSKTIFVANLPFDVSEEQLSHVFSQVGPTASVEIKVDTATGRSKGYAFVHYHDHQTANSAVRNLHEVLVNGRNLRVEMSSDEPTKRRTGGPGGGGGGGGRPERGPPGGGPPPGGGRGGPPGRPDDFQPPYGGGPPGRIPGPDPSFGGGSLPPGQDLPPGVSATDAITRTLAGMPPGQLEEVLGSMKTLVDTRPDEAAAILNQKPQLAYALMQSMVLLNIHPPSIINQIRSNARPPPPQAQPFPPQSAPTPSYPPSYPPQQPPMGGYSAPPPQAGGYPPYGQAPPAQGPAPIPAAAQAAIATLPEDQRATLVQVLQMTPDQIALLDPTQRASVVELRRQFLG